MKGAVDDKVKIAASPIIALRTGQFLGVYSHTKTSTNNFSCCCYGNRSCCNLKVQAHTTTGSGRLFLTYPSYSKVYKSRVVFFSSLVPEPEAMAFLEKN